MVKDFIEQRRELVSLILLTAAVGFGVLILVKITSYYSESAQAEAIVLAAIKHNEPNEADTKARIEKSKEVAKDLKDRNLFAPPEPKRHPVDTVDGIFGDEILIGNKWYKEGQNVGDAKIVSIEPTRVVIEWEGNRKTFAPILAAGGGDGDRGGRGGRSRQGGDRGRGADNGGSNNNGGAERVDVSSEGPSTGGFGPGDRGGFRGRGDMRARWDNMSERERDEFRERMRERFGGRRPGGFRGRGGDFGGRGGFRGRGR